MDYKNEKEKLGEALLIAKNNERFSYEMLGFWCYLNDVENMNSTKKCLDVFISQRMSLEKQYENFNFEGMKYGL